MKIKKISDQEPEFCDIKKWYETHLHPDANNYDDQKVYDYVYKDGNFAGIFQCTGHGAQKLFKNAKPQNITDIATITAIYRPGPLSANVDKIYLDALKGKKFEWGHPLFDKVLGDTYSCCIFQEQIMQLAEIIGKFPKDQCDNIRRAIMKRDLSKGAAAIAEAKKLEDDYVKGAMENGIKEETARTSYQNILSFAAYGFNRCVLSESLVYTYKLKNNKIYVCKKMLKNVKSGDIVLSRNEKTQKNIFVKVKQVHYNGKKKLVEVKLKSGQKIQCTLDHKFRVQETGEMLPLNIIIKKNLSIVIQ